MYASSSLRQEHRVYNNNNNNECPSRKVEGSPLELGLDGNKDSCLKKVERETNLPSSLGMETSKNRSTLSIISKESISTTDMTNNCTETNQVSACTAPTPSPNEIITSSSLENKPKDKKTVLQQLSEGFDPKNFITDQKPTSLVENVLTKLIISPKLVTIVLIVQYSFLLLHTYLSQGTTTLFIMLLTCVAALLSNSKYIAASLWAAVDSVVDDETSNYRERNRMLFNMVLFSVRYFLLEPANRIILVPIYLMVITSANALRGTYAIWAFLPPYYIAAHYFTSACFNCVQVILKQGLSQHSLLTVSQSISIMLCILLYSFYIVTISINLKSKVKTLEKTGDQLEKALSAKQTFLRHISHEFRSPCLSSLGSVELLRETALTPIQQELVDTIASADGILLTLIEDILTLVKLEYEQKSEKNDSSSMGSSNPFRDIKTFSLGQSTKILENIIKSYAKHFRVNFKVQIDEQTKSTVVRGNQQRIHQIITNLLTNAVKASKPYDTVELTCCLSGPPKTNNGNMLQQDVTFQVMDHGCGIPKEKQRIIFEPFSQLHNVNESVYPGSGLGLSIVLHHVRSMGGTILLNSEIGKGSTFTITLPLEVVTAENTDEAQVDTLIQRQLSIQEEYLRHISQSEQHDRPITPNAHIIIADDNSINRKIISKLIESIGYAVDCVNDGQQLIENFNKDRHNIVITDLNMPKLNGYEAAKILKSRSRNVKIFALTADVLAELPSTIFDAVLFKPCQKATLKELLEKFYPHD
ncbi:hypothetical protein C9374_014302 [Naegleria lovaniensis]|uniref:histidine kinase n=1 Tax=Naegleria lovaniensis TaxID=51637 RepID=A0AA88GB98_NAELO|nr:uncharacterized protein C9374_014302 [Naegleria lovaniensis]KAG2370711.1 hypothetical protein C9374_014302 [Naegleria lovaniensis]